MDAPTETSKSLTRKRTDDELMPPPTLKRIKRPKLVLDEDTYTEALSHIIARDFFPGLLESETQQEYLDAIEARDEEWISSAARRLRSVMTPRGARGAPTRQPGGATPIGQAGETPKTLAPASGESTHAHVDANMSLGAFQSKYTSEDNESFYKLLDRQNQKRAGKYAWLWTGNKLPSKMQLKQREVEQRLLQTRGPAALIDDGFKRDRLAIRHGDRDSRPAAPDHWKSKPNNELMFAPDGVDDVPGLESVAQQAQAASRAPPKAIVYANTRAPNPAPNPAPNRDVGDVPPSPSLSAIRDAIAGRRRPGDGESTVDGWETPRVNGYAFVDDEEPEPATPPTRAPPIDLGPGDATPNPFRMQGQSRREALHHGLVDRISAMKRTSVKLGFTGKADKTPVPKFPSSPRVSGGLTPAGQRLWGKIGSAGNKMTDSPFSGSVKTTPRGKMSGLRKPSSAKTT